MGNHCGILSTSKPEIQEQDDPQTAQQDESNFLPLYTLDDDHHINTTSATGSNTPFLRTPDLMGIGGARSSSPSDDTKASILDPKLLSLLEFFRQLHVRRDDIYNRIIPVHRESLEDIFNKMGTNIEQEEKKKHKSKKMGVMLRQRSLSVGNADDLRLNRFKVKPIDAGGEGSPLDGNGGGGKGGGGGTSGGTKQGVEDSRRGSIR